MKSDHKEFFAGVTTRYFGTKTEREALVERDPVLAKLLEVKLRAAAGIEGGKQGYMLVNAVCFARDKHHVFPAELGSHRHRFSIPCGSPIIWY